MTIDLCSKNSGTGTGNTITMSPRISFSHDLSNSDTVPVEQLLRSLSSSSATVDFNFSVQQNSDHHHHHADELFSNGKIVTKQFKRQKPPPPAPVPPPPPPANQNSPAPVDDEQQNSSKSFWGFKRSSSCGNGYARSLCPIPLLSRSNSTGSSPASANTKRSSSSKEGFTQKHHQKPPLRKMSYCYGNSNNNNISNGVRVNPVLNLGFGSFFSKKK